MIKDQLINLVTAVADNDDLSVYKSAVGQRAYFGMGFAFTLMYKFVVFLILWDN